MLDRDNALFPCARPDFGPVARTPSEGGRRRVSGFTPDRSLARNAVVARLLAFAVAVATALAIGPSGAAAFASSDATASPAAADGGSPYLVIRDNGGTELLALPLTDWPRWILRWNHSVTGIRVSDHYAFREGSMMLTASHTPAFDAGLGHIPGRGRQVSDGAGGYWILDLDEPVPGNAYLLRVGPMRVNHRIWHAGRTYSLSELAADSRVKISVETR